jgi:small subunit ribosomal protein S20
MPTSASGKKALRVADRKRVFNDRRRKTMKTTTKSFSKLIESKDIKGAEKLVPALYKSIDKAVKSGVLKKNTAARKKSRLVGLIVKAKKS